MMRIPVFVVAVTAVMPLAAGLSIQVRITPSVGFPVAEDFIVVTGIHPSFACFLPLQFYSDPYCDSPTPAYPNIYAFNGLCTATSMETMLGTTCTSATSATITSYLTGATTRACSGAPMWTATIRSDYCTPINDPYFSNFIKAAKIVGGTCNAPAPVYIQTFYLSDICYSLQAGSYTTIGGGSCYASNFQGAYNAAVVGTGANTVAMSVGAGTGAGNSPLCNNVATLKGINNIGQCNNLTGSPLFGKNPIGMTLVAASPYTSGVASIATSLAARLVAVLTLALSILAY
jgi:hypothetical protein